MKIYFKIGALVAVLLAGLGLGYLLFGSKPVAPKVDSVVIYNRLQSQGFLVTQDYIFEQKIEIDNTSGQMWKDLFWGQKIEASAIIKASLGVDLKKLNQEDVKIDADKIVLTLPAVEVQSTEIIGEIKLNNQQGVLKMLFDKDDGYNQALAQFKEQAKTAAQKDEIVTEARNNTKKELQRLVNLMGVDKEVVVEFK